MHSIGFVGVFCYRQLLGNGTLYFPPFLAQDFQAGVHNARYRCRATSSEGTVLSREVTLRAGIYQIQNMSILQLNFGKLILGMKFFIPSIENKES